MKIPTRFLKKIDIDESNIYEGLFDDQSLIYQMEAEETKPNGPFTVVFKKIEKTSEATLAKLVERLSSVAI